MILLAGATAATDGTDDAALTPERKRIDQYHHKRPDATVKQSVAPHHEEKGTMRCDMCGSQNIRLVSGGKYICLTCGFLPS